MKTGGQDCVVSIATHTDWTVLGSHPGGGKIVHALKTGPKALPASCTMAAKSLLKVR